VVVLLGAELNAELEHQTAKDTTKGPEKPMGPWRHHGQFPAHREGIAPQISAATLKPARRLGIPHVRVF
jgi:hypothetical protein